MVRIRIPISRNRSDKHTTSAHIHIIIIIYNTVDCTEISVYNNNKYYMFVYYDRRGTLLVSIIFTNSYYNIIYILHGIGSSALSSNRNIIIDFELLNCVLRSTVVFHIINTAGQRLNYYFEIFFYSDSDNCHGFLFSTLKVNTQLVENLEVTSEYRLFLPSSPLNNCGA